MIVRTVGNDDDSEQLAATRRTLALLQAQAEAVRADLANLRRETAQAKLELSGLRTAQLVEVNDRLVEAAVQADSAAQTAVSSLDELTRSTQHDELTGATNRVLMLDRLESAIARAQRSSARVGLLFVDLDGFKQINDTLGHAIGDQVLRLAAQRLGSVVRESDSVSRHGGDEFVVLLAEISTAADAAPIARKMLEALALPARIGPHTLSLLASIGIAVYPDDGADAVTLIRHADAAMYRSKRRGPGGHEFWQSDENTDSGYDTGPEPPLPAATRRADTALSEHEARLRGLLDANRELVGAAQVARQLQADAEAAHHRQINFVAMAAHALRNPLSAIRMATAVLSSPQVDDPTRTRQLQLVQRQAALIARLIDDLLDGSRVDTGAFRLQCRDLELDALLGAAADSCRHAIDAKRQRLIVAAPAAAVVHGDAQRLIQVFANLLNNASRRSPPGGAVSLTTKLAAGEVVVTVADEGAGIAPDVLAGIFDLFAVDTEVPLEESGLGIGLAVVRALAEAHGGSVGASSAHRGRGSAFVVRLPRNGATPDA